jgi:glycine/D-amino acid oxidase-like deaminating enzyme
MRYGIVGFGAIGLYAALVLSRDPENKLSIFLGNQESQKYAATTAAGAMHAVYGELESHDDFFTNQALVEKGIQSRIAWRELLDTMFPKILTAPNTYILLKDQCTDFERNNYETVKSFAEADGVWIQKNQADVSNILRGSRCPQEVGELVGEFGFDARALLRSAYSFLRGKTNVQFVDDSVLSFERTKRKVICNSGFGQVELDRLIIASGARMDALAESSGYSVVPMLKGVGLAISLKFNQCRLRNQDRVVRSVNRGGAQCGFHAVPNHGSRLYIGAGNYVSRTADLSEAKTATLHYLLESARYELLSDDDLYTSSIETYLGERPRTIDGAPILGPLKDDQRIFFAGGFNRVGLTLAPWIFESIHQFWCRGELREENWIPERSPITNELTSTAQKFFESRVANEIEHGRTEIAKKYSFDQAVNLVKAASKKAQTEYELPDHFILDCDAVSAFLSEAL